MSFNDDDMRDPEDALSYVWGTVKGKRRSVPTKNVSESMINATVTPYSETTKPPAKAPRHKAVDQVALSKALAVVRSSFLTIFGRAARSAVT